MARQSMARQGMARPRRTAAVLLPMRVWDLPTRLFHWVLVLLLLASWATAEIDQVVHDYGMRPHMLLGYAAGALLLFRLVWGFAGSETSRFGKFLVSPLAGLRHLGSFARREADTQVGHNAAGGWMVLMLLLILMVQVATGLCANDDGSAEGPLAKYVGKPNSDVLSYAHAVNFKIILAGSALHILAVASYAFLKGQNLLRPMLTGKKRLPAATRAPRMVSPLLAIVILILAGAIMWAVATFA